MTFYLFIIIQEYLIINIENGYAMLRFLKIELWIGKVLWLVLHAVQQFVFRNEVNKIMTEF